MILYVYMANACVPATSMLTLITKLAIGNVTIGLQQAEQVEAHVLSCRVHPADQQSLEDPVRVPATVG